MKEPWEEVWTQGVGKDGVLIRVIWIQVVSIVVHLRREGFKRVVFRYSHISIEAEDHCSSGLGVGFWKFLDSSLTFTR